MMNILLAGVGGQGLVMTTGIICDVAFRSGFDVKSNDVVGLSQRGGKVWGSVRFGEVVNSPNIEVGQADILLALEPLEGLRWQHYLKPGGRLLTNTTEIYPVYAIAEQAPYPSDFNDHFRKDLQVQAIDALQIGIEAGSTKVVNVVLLGALARILDMDLDLWQEVILENVPSKTKDINLQAFKRGYEFR